jgi:hypothetical protein
MTAGAYSGSAGSFASVRFEGHSFSSDFPDSDFTDWDFADWRAVAGTRPAGSF